MDIVENSVRAGASRIHVGVEVSREANRLRIRIADNGRGMTQEEKSRCEDPFYTTKACGRTGLGIALLKQSALEAEGSFELRSEKGTGTEITAEFRYDHIDRRPLGDIARSFYILIAAFPHVDFILTHERDGGVFELDTAEIKKELGDIPIHAPDVLKTLRRHIAEGIRSLEENQGGTDG